jgi:chromate transporter
VERNNSMEPATAVETVEGAQQCSLRALFIYFLRLGTLGFGGPIALVGYMHRDLVEGRK